MHSVDPDSTLGRILNFIGQNLKVDKLFIDLGFDPNHFTWDAVFHRVVEVAWANVTVANSLALVGAIFYVATLMMRTIVPLRVIGIISIAFFIAYGVVAGAVSTFLLYLLSLPINVIRLRQMLTLVKKARTSAQGDLSMDWLRPYMTPRKYRKGDVLFRKGDVGNEMFLTVSVSLHRKIGEHRRSNASRAERFSRLPTRRCSSFTFRIRNLVIIS